MDTPADERRWEEQLDVWRNRYEEARKAGLEHRDAMRFARSGYDIGRFRFLVRKHCAPELIARIVR